MVKKMGFVLLAIVLACYFTVPAVAQDKPAKDAKTAVAKEAGSVKQIACDDACGFVVRSRNEKELISVTKHHAKTFHKMDLTDAQVKTKITDVPGK
jgi:predicted small metal-binding protein